ncbi:MAG: porin family protein [Bacteroidales bacterium]
MKNSFAFIFLIIITFYSFSQEKNSLQSEKNKGKDIFILDLFTDIWQDVPANTDVRTINQGINIYGMLNLPIGYSNFSLGGGLGVSSHNFYSDAIPVLGRNLSNSLTGTTEFIKLGDYYGRQINYSINKINTTSIEIPFELKYKTRADRNKRFKASIGWKIGYNISNHSKYRGEDVLENTSDIITIKKTNIKYLNNWNYGITARIGFGMYNLMLYYSLSKMFEKDKGPQYYPISLGISITPF